jgi:peptidyl-prolyl cis-trans isomerase SurA
MIGSAAMHARWPLLLLGLMTVAPASLRAGPPKSRKIERVVALVDGKPIWLSDLRKMARPLRAELESLPPNKRAAALPELYRQVLDALITRRLVARAALESGITVPAADVDRALEQIAKQNEVGIPELMRHVQASGISEADYRAEVAAQLLEMKLLALRVKSVGGSNPEQELAAAHERWVKELRKKSLVEIRLLP